MAKSIHIKLANSNDLNGIIKLQEANQTSQGGTLSGQLTRDQIHEMMNDMPQIIAVIDDEIVGFFIDDISVCEQQSKSSYCRCHVCILFRF